ncbi:MAG: cytochrome C oxidase subunit IV family protein [bacterium]
MSETHKEPNYRIVFIALALLTALEVGIVFVPIAKLVVGIALIVLAFAKASLVALYFMHLRYEKFALGIIALTPLIICTLLIIGLLPDLAGTSHQARNQQTVQVEATKQLVDTSK